VGVTSRCNAISPPSLLPVGTPAEPRLRLSASRHKLYSTTPRSRGCLITCITCSLVAEPIGPSTVQTECGVRITSCNLQASAVLWTGTRAETAPDRDHVHPDRVAHMRLPHSKRSATQLGFALQKIRVNDRHWTSWPAPPTQRALFASFTCTADRCNLAHTYVL